MRRFERRAPRRAPPRSRSDGGRSRRRPGCRSARRAPRIAARRRGIPRSPAAMRSNGSPSSRPTATAASAFCRLCRPGHLQRQRPERRRRRRRSPRRATRRVTRRLDAQRLEHDVGRGHVGVRRVEPVGRHAPRHPRQHGARDADRRRTRPRAVERHLVGEVDERLLQVVEAAVVLEVLVIDVRHHRNRRQQLQERPVAFVRLGDHQLAASEPRVAAERAQPPADHRRRIEPGALEHQRDHRRRRRLAVRARDRDAEAQPHQLGQHLGARNHRNLPPRRLAHFRVRRPHRRRHHHDVGVADVRRVVPVRDRGCRASPAAR